MMRRALLSSVTLALAGVLCACAEKGPEAEIRATRTATRAYSPVKPGASGAERFSPAGTQATPPGSDDLLDYDLPRGWKRLAPTADRLVNLQPAGAAGASCYLSFIAGSAGGLTQNVNRWLGQLGGSPLAEEAIAALPRHELLGREATLVEVQGTYSAMGGAPQPNTKLLGLAASEPEGSLFLKFVGPAELVDAERESFLALASSLHMAEAHTSGGSAAPAQGAAPAPSGGAGALSWKVPAGWKEAPPRPMREVTFALEQNAECYISVLAGDAGGLEANLNRWSQQCGGRPLDPATLAGLPRLQVLGQSVPLLEVEGTFTGMGDAALPGQALLGVASIGPEVSVFVKLTGPASVVHAQRANFTAFVTSLERR